MTQPISGVTFAAWRSMRCQGRKTEGPRRALIRQQSYSRGEGQCGGEIGQLHGKRKPSVTTFLRLHSSTFPFPFSAPPVILNTVLLSHTTLMVAEPDCVCLHSCSYLCMHVQFPLNIIPAIIEARNREPSFQHEQKVRMRRGKAPASILYPLLGCSCP